MAETFENKLVDRRVVNRNLRKGLVDEREWAAHLKALPDLADQAVSIEAALDGDELDDPDDAAGA
jgi:hypothetical protein